MSQSVQWMAFRSPYPTRKIQTTDKSKPHTIANNGQNCLNRAMVLLGLGGGSDCMGRSLKKKPPTTLVEDTRKRFKTFGIKMATRLGLNRGRKGNSDADLLTMRSLAAGHRRICRTCIRKPHVKNRGYVRAAFQTPPPALSKPSTEVHDGNYHT